MFLDLVGMQINAELDQALRTSGISSATRIRNTQLELEQTEQPWLVFGRQQGGTRPSTLATPRGLA